MSVTRPMRSAIEVLRTGSPSLGCAILASARLRGDKACADSGELRCRIVMRSASESVQVVWLSELREALEELRNSAQHGTHVLCLVCELLDVLVESLDVFPEGHEPLP